jgi:3-deoxy-D-manno-octulosonic-acid transferase
MPPKPSPSRFIDRAIGAGVAGYIGLVDRTSTVPPLMHLYAAELLANHPMILAMWHGQFMLLPTMARFGIPTKAMLALHRDAEGLGHALDRYGIELIRGAGASAKGKDRGGSNAFRGAVRALENGFSVAMTADVPPGPARRAGHGIVMLAKVSGRPILPVAMSSSRYIALPTWSRMTINLPGSRLGASFGAPIFVPVDASPEQLESLRRDVETQLNIATIDAYNRAGVSHLRATPSSALTAAGERTAPGRKLKAYVHGMRFAAPIAPAVLAWRSRHGKEDKGRQPERFGIASQPRPVGTVLWFHAASVGETIAVLPLIDAMKAKRPLDTMLLTTGTVTSAQLAGARIGGRTIHQYVPLDIPAYVAQFLEHWQPSLGVFVESEIWPNLILEAAKRDVPMALVNARMSKTSFRRWRAHSTVSRPLFSRFSAVLAQSREFADRFTALGAPGVRDVGNLKFDAPPPPVDATRVAAARAELAGRPLWLAASTHADEELLVADAHSRLRSTHPELVTAIVPRHPERGPAISASLAAQGFGVTLRSRETTMPAAGGGITTGILVADTLGELGSWFALAPVVFMGKSLSRDGGGHNPIEPVRLGACVLTGPSVYNFDIVFRELLKAGGAREVRDAASLADEVGRLLDDAEAREKMRLAATAVVDKLTGALARTVDVLMALLPPVEHAAPAQTEG